MLNYFSMKNVIENVSKKVHNAYLIDQLLTFTFLILMVGIVITGLFIVPSYDSFEISEWLINYQHGIVRRGLLGELLLDIFCCYPYPVKTLLIIIEIVSFFFFFLRLILYLRSVNLSVLPVLLPFVCCQIYLPWYRRDFLVLLLLSIQYEFLFRGLANKKYFKLLVSIILSVLLILIYEPVFFVLFPVNAWILYSYYISEQKKTGVLLFSCFFLIQLLIMAIVCVKHGDNNTAIAIWKSWENLFILYPESPINTDIGSGVSFMGWKTSEVYNWHLTMNFHLDNIFSIQALSQYVGTLFLFFCLYYVVTRVPRLYNKHVMNNKAQTELGTILIFQFIMMIPMLILLSIDYGRTIPYIIYTTFMIFVLTKKYNFELCYLPIISTLSIAISSKVNNIKILSNPNAWFFFLIMMPLKAYPSPSLEDNIIIHMLMRVLRYL